MIDKEYLKKLVLFFVLLIGLGLIVAGYSYLNSQYNFGIPCTLNKIFGIYCSGCGLTRAAGAMLEFDFYQAIRYNAFSIVLLPLLLIFIVTAIWEYLFNKPSFIAKIPMWFWIGLFSFVLIYGIVRNFIPELQPIEV